MRDPEREKRMYARRLPNINRTDLPDRERLISEMDLTKIRDDIDDIKEGRTRRLTNPVRQALIRKSWLSLKTIRYKKSR